MAMGTDRPPQRGPIEPLGTPYDLSKRRDTAPSTGLSKSMSSLPTLRRTSAANRVKGTSDNLYWSSQCERRRQTNMVQRELTEGNCTEQDELLWGAHGAEGFRKLLCARYGSLPAAFRVGLDRDGNGMVSIGEFHHCCREIGFTGNLKKLWAELDEDGDGFMSLKELDAEAAQGLEDFKQFCQDSFGTSLAAWQRGINPEGTYGVTAEKFVEQCKRIGYGGCSSKKLFRWLRTDPHHKELTLQDFDPQAASAVFRADACADSISGRGGKRALNSHTPSRSSLSPVSGSRRSTSELLPDWRGALAGSEALPSLSPNEPESDSQVTSPSASMSGKAFVNMLRSKSQPAVASTRSAMWMAEVSMAHVAVRKAAKQWKDKSDIGIKTLAELKNHLVVKFGSVFNGWRVALDPAGKGKLGFVEFCERLREIGYLGDVKALWASLGARATGFVGLRDLDPQADALLGEFRLRVLEKYGNMLSAWTKGFDPGDRGCVDVAVFEKRCKAAGFEGDAPRLFSLLQPDHQGKFLTLRNFDLPAYNSFTRNDREMVTEGGAKKEAPLAMSFSERQASGKAAKWSSTLGNTHREDVRCVSQKAMSMDLGPDDARSLKAALVRKYGTLPIAWRRALDPQARGRITFDELGLAVRQNAGFIGSTRQLWDDLAAPGSDFLTMQDLDPGAAEALVSFRALLLRKHDNLVAAWREGLDPKQSGCLGEEEFCARCGALGYEGDARQLFAALRPESHARHITIGDLDPLVRSSYYRGDDAAMTVRGKPAKLPPVGEQEDGGPSEPGSPAPGSPAHGSPAAGRENRAARHTTLSKWSNELGKKHRDSLHRSTQEEHEKRSSIQSLPDFRRMLASRFGSTVAAFRSMLDGDASGRLSFGRLSCALDRIGFAGNMRQIWRELDSEGSGQIALQDLDPAAHQALEAVRSALLEQYGSLAEAP